MRECVCLGPSQARNKTNKTAQSANNSQLWQQGVCLEQNSMMILEGRGRKDGETKKMPLDCFAGIVVITAEDRRLDSLQIEGISHRLKPTLLYEKGTYPLHFGGASTDCC